MSIPVLYMTAKKQPKPNQKNHRSLHISFTITCSSRSPTGTPSIEESFHKQHSKAHTCSRVSAAQGPTSVFGPMFNKGKTLRLWTLPGFVRNSPIFSVLSTLKTPTLPGYRSFECLLVQTLSTTPTFLHC